MPDRNYTRRDFLLSLGVAGAAGAALSACGNGDTPPATTPDVPPATEQRPTPTGDIVASECPGYENLSESELAIRNTLNYTDVTPEPGQYCHNCRFIAEGDYGDCIGCQLFPGPVAPEGWCSSWAAEA